MQNKLNFFLIGNWKSDKAISCPHQIPVASYCPCGSMQGNPRPSTTPNPIYMRGLINRSGFCTCPLGGSEMDR